MPTFFVPSDQIHDNTVVILGSDAHHLQAVLRVKMGELVSVSDGRSQFYRVKVTEIRAEAVIGLIIENKGMGLEPSTEITLVQALPKHPKMEWVIQKGVEVGVSKFLPVVTERCIPKFSGEKSKRQQERWQKIAEQAAKQCNRGKIPIVLSIIDWEKALEFLGGMEMLLLPWEGETQNKIRPILAGARVLKSLAILIGPEGGFSLQEVQQAEKIGAKTVTLGSRILRTETAGLITSALALYELGQLG